MKYYYALRSIEKKESRNQFFSIYKLVSVSFAFFGYNK